LYKVAIIEDVEDVMNLYRMSFGKLSDKIECSYYLDGSTALVDLRDNRYDLIICDLKMPGISGMEVIDELRHSSANVSSLVFIVSGFVNEEIRKFADDFRDIKIFEKPLTSNIKFAEECLEILGTRRELKYDPELLETVRSAAMDLLSQYFSREPIIGRCQLSPLNTHQDSLRGFISFRGKNFDGSIAVDLGQGFLELFAKKLDLNDAASPSDVTYEMANELAGQFKSTVLKKGYEITLGIPSTKKLSEVEEIRSSRQDDVVYIPAGYIGSLFRIEFCMSIPDFSFSEKQESEDSMESGAVFLFD